MTRGRFVDLTGKRFGRLVVLKRSRKKGKRGEIYWHCKCDCGNILEVVGISLNHGRTQSCGCLGMERRREANLKPDIEVATNLLYLKYKHQAARREIDFELSQEEFQELIYQNCYYCGSLPSNVFKNYRKSNNANHQPVLYNGIDRVDNNKGYTVENSVPCCYTCNYAKRSFSKEQFLGWVKKVYHYNFKRSVELTVGQLIDQLVTITIKCFYEQEKVMNAPEGSSEALKAAKRAQELNAKRNKLIRSIDSLLGFEADTVTEKTYG